MLFDEVHALIPYVTEGELHSQQMDIYPNVRIKQPGRHAQDTVPLGGDFVVEVNCDTAKWDWHQFTHTDIFKDVESKTSVDPALMQQKVAPVLSDIVLNGVDPTTQDESFSLYELPGLFLPTLFETTQLLAVAEHRRYFMYEKNGGGRFLPLRFAVGIMYGYWTAAEATKVQRRGSHGLRELYKAHGAPPTIKRILDGRIDK